MALVMSIISPRRFIVGGAAMLAADMINHKRVVRGNSERSPLDIYILRVLVNS